MIICVKNSKKILLNQKKLEGELKVKLSLRGRTLSIEGKEEKEYFASLVIEAFDFGFTLADSLKLSDENFIFFIIKIKDITKKKNLESVRGRIIGKQGKTLKTLSELSNCSLILRDNEVGIISPSEEIKSITIALESLIRGAKQSNVYSFLEKHQPEEIWDFGIKEKKVK